ncbi:hypothetical protein AWC38_SpisGene9293 [Stylophora pistillata]|uniref:Uncharacterized protein n=1 Tax=Stylophora pistillata TaxID=50429 RepID=A0A2B4SB52_STYPI|nr:hypothetical protein AWC38_SpisGene9293 [Stylophora pistillata]
MSERITLSLHISDANVQTRAFRSHSFNNPPTLSTHRSRRTLSLPAREKPIIPPPISEIPEECRLDDENHPSEQKPIQSYTETFTENCHDEIHWFTPIAGLLISLLLYMWACLLSLSADEKNIIS